jgi:hypothetical protein
MGKNTKLYKKNLEGEVSFRGSLGISYITKYYRTNPKLLIINISIAIIISFLGYTYSGLAWTLILLAISILVILLIPSAKTNLIDKIKNWKKKRIHL